MKNKTTSNKRRLVRLVEISKPILRRKKKITYLDCVKKMPLLSIKNDVQHQCFLRKIEELMDKKRSVGEDQYLDALSDLVHVYEQKSYHPDEVSPADLLKQILQDRGLSQSQAAKDLGLARSTVSELVNGKKEFTIKIAKVVAEKYNVRASSLVGMK